MLSEQWQILSWPACSKLALVLVAEQSWHLGEELKPWQERRSEGGLDQPLLISTATTAAALLDTPWRQWIKVELPLSSEVCTKDTTFDNSPRRLLFSSSVMGMKGC